MIYKPQSTDKSPDPYSDPFETVLPLCFNTIYYMESAENEGLNNLVRKYFQQDPNDQLPRDLRRFPYRFRYVTQAEVEAEHLRELLAENGSVADSPALAETIDFVRECLHADTGGFLVARQMTESAYEHTADGKPIPQQEHLLTFPLHLANNRSQSIENFVWYVANNDFESLAGVSYYRYNQEKNERHEQSARRSAPGTMTLSFITMPLDTKKIDKEIDRKAQKLNSKLNKYFPDNEAEALEIVERIVEIRKNKLKIDTFCPLAIEKDGKFFYTLNGEKIAFNFVRGPLGKTLYILYLRQIERAAADPTGKTPTYICRNHLNKYKEELFDIYEMMNATGNYSERKQRIDNLWRSPNNVIDKNNKFFEDNFNMEAIAPKYYTIEKVGFDDKGDILDAVGLEKEDFDLGPFSIRYLK